MNALFLQSDVADPYPLYAQRLATRPVYLDAEHGIWAIHSYAACKAILDSTAHVPPPPDLSLLSEEAAALVQQLVRLSNPPHHAARRRIAEHLHQCMVQIDAHALTAELLPAPDVPEFDWVSTVCKVLPPLAILRGLRFAAQDIAAILPHTETLTYLMRSGKDATQARMASEAVAAVRPRVERHLQRTLGMADDAAVANLIGLLIQSYDAGRGLLGNALLQMLAHPVPDAALAAAVIETMRFDPPIHNTRRVLCEEMELEGCRLPQGSTVLLVLAAANRDPARFAQPDRYDPMRRDSMAHLGFGAGMHACVASHFSVQLAVGALKALRGRYGNIVPGQERISWEPLVNARLAREIRLHVR